MQARLWFCFHVRDHKSVLRKPKPLLAGAMKAVQWHSPMAASAEEDEQLAAARELTRWAKVDVLLLG